jgi:hypothetical protein
LHPRELRTPRLPVGLRQQHAQVEELVEQDGVSRQVVGGPLRRAHQLRETRQHRRMLGQEREIRAAPAHRFEESEQPMEHGLRIGGVVRRSRGRREQLRHQRVDALL